MSQQIEGVKEHPNFQYFDPRQIDLQRELCHPHWQDLCEKIKNHDDMAVRNDFTVQLAFIATELEIILEGVYEQNDLCGVLATRMKQRRTQASQIIIDVDPSSILPNGE